MLGFLALGMATKGREGGTEKCRGSARVDPRSSRIEGSECSSETPSRPRYIHYTGLDWVGLDLALSLPSPSLQPTFFQKCPCVLPAYPPLSVLEPISHPAKTGDPLLTSAAALCRPSALHQIRPAGSSPHRTEDNHPRRWTSKPLRTCCSLTSKHDQEGEEMRDNRLPPSLRVVLPVHRLPVQRSPPSPTRLEPLS